MKRSIVLVEVIFSIVLFSIIATYSMNILLSLYEKKNTATSQTLNKIKLESTRLFLIKNNDFTNIRFDNSVLYFKDNILLDNISLYNLTTLDKIATINICIYDNTICQNWKIKSL